MKTLQDKLQQLKSQGRLRSLKLPRGIDLTSNDYLGMRTHPKLRETAIKALESGIDIGAGGSRLLRGHSQIFQDLEDYAAEHFGSERALYLANGFAANDAIFSTLPNRHDTIIFDALIHASARAAIAASHAKSIKVAHNDLNEFESALKSAKGKIWVAVESLYSMDGDFAPLHELQKLCQKYEATLIVDEAHSTGVFGNRGKGLCDSLEKKNLVVLHTCGKAVGVAGGIICAEAETIEYLINAARPFIYSTAPMPLQALLAQTSLEILSSADGDERRNRLRELVTFMKAKSQIVPIILGDDNSAVKAAAILQEAGFDIRAIRPPTVPENTARLRLSLSVNINEKQLEEFSATLLPYLQKQAA